jgi:sugar phosphate permease
VLAAGTAAQASYLALVIGLPVLAPALQDELGIGLTEVGLLIAAPWVGAVVTLMPWGLLADRVGERFVLAGGLGFCGLLLLPAAVTSNHVLLIVLLVLAGAAGASVNAASGRAVMSWFGADQRGLALGIRQTATPVGGIIAAIALPPIEEAGGLAAAFVALGTFTLATAAVGALVVRDVPAESGLGEAPAVLRNAQLWLLGISGALYLVAQVAIMGFLVLFLHEEHGLSTQEAAAVLAIVQGVAIVVRIGVGRWSDLIGTRIRPLRLLGLGAFGSLALAAAVVEAPTWGVLLAFVIAGALSMSWNGLSFTAAAEFVGRARSGAAIGFQQTVLVGSGAAVPPLFAVIVEAASWRVAYAVAAVAPLAGWALLLRLRER